MSSYRTHTTFINEMSEYVLSHLRGSSESQSKIYDPDPPHRSLILGSLAPKETDGSIDTKTSIRNNSISIRFKVVDSIPLPIELNYSVYVRDEENDTEDGIPCWKRHVYSDQFILSNNDDSNIISFTPSGSENSIQYSLRVQYREIILDSEKQIEIDIVNESVDKDAFIYDVKAKIEVPLEKIIPYHYSYVYEDEEYPVDPTPYVRTLNCYADYTDDTIVISSVSEHILYKRSPKIHDNDLNISFKDLMSVECISFLKKYSNRLEKYVKYYSELTPGLNTTEREQIDHLNKIYLNFNDGISLLESEHEILIAFRLMNEAFSISASYPSWRLFQITYIVSSLRSVFDPNFDRDVCDIIHVSTGGGKTEAYLGLVVFTALYDRIRGYFDGVSAIVKFPLRMLSIQQLKRVAAVTAIADYLKNRENIPGSPISLSYFVGNSPEFPNKTHEALEEIRRYNDETGQWPEGRIMTECPFCDYDVKLHIENESILHVCSNPNCIKKFYIYYTDEEVYRYLPSIVISTVDKFATVSRTRHIKNLFGAKTDYCPDHGHISKGEDCLVCGKRGLPFDKKSAAPSLVVQDELHLIRESFGTIDAHFESFCDELQRSLVGFIPKRISLTATITGSRHQIEQLYNKEPFIFPGKFPDSDKDPFFINERDEQGNKLTHRIIYGMKPNGRDNQTAILISLRHVSKFLWEFEQNIQSNAKRYGCSVEECDRLIEYHNKILTYHGKISDVHTINHFLDDVVNTDDMNRYTAKGYPLLGERSLAEIGDLIKSVESHKRSDDAGMHCTFSTSIVSHGVDIKEWNVMFFQGMPVSTAEYIQALSRVGRKYPGVVFVWFYPNRIRDLSFYGHFDEYHGMIEHKVEPVSINKWTALSLHETFTSVFNGALMNYVSAILDRPLFKRGEVVKALSEQKNKDSLLEFLNKVYRVDSEFDGSEYFKMEIPNMMNDRLEHIFEEEDIGKDYFPLIFDSLANSDRYYSTQLGMRGIQDNVIFTPGSNTLIFLKGSGKYE